MIVPYLVGYIVGSGYTLLLIVVLILFQLIYIILQFLGNLYVNYRFAHPITPASRRRSTIIVYGTITFLMVSDVIYVFFFTNTIHH